MWKVTPRPHLHKQGGSVKLPAGARAHLPPMDGGAKVEYLATLSKHTAVVNVVRWSPDGQSTTLLLSTAHKVFIRC